VKRKQKSLERKNKNSTTQTVSRKPQIPKPNIARILLKMRSRHPLSVFSTTVAFPYLHLQATTLPQ